MSKERWQVLTWAGRLIKMAALSAWSSRFGVGYIEGTAVDTGLGQQAGQQKVTFYQWQGFRVKPKAQGTQAVVLAPRAGSSNAVAVACDDLTSGPMPTEELEPVIYDGAGSSITFRADKSIEILTGAGAKALLDANGSIWLIPATGQTVKEGTAINAELDRLVTVGELNEKFQTIIGHKHPETGAETGVSAELAIPGALNMAGSPNCYAKKP